jgi:hypothetical protein
LDNSFLLSIFVTWLAIDNYLYKNISMQIKCINDDFSKVIEELKKESNGIPLKFPQKGELYTIRETFDNDGLVTSYLLNEIYNPTFFIPVIQQRRELSFAEWRFEHITENVEIEQIELVNNY